MKRLTSKEDYTTIRGQHTPFQIDANFGYKYTWSSLFFWAQDIQSLHGHLFLIADSQLLLLRCCFRAHRMICTCSLPCHAISGPEAVSRGSGLGVMWLSTYAGMKGSFRKHCYGQTMGTQSQGCTMVNWLLPSQFAAALFTSSTEDCSAWRLGPLASNCLVCFHRNQMKKYVKSGATCCITSRQYAVIQFRFKTSQEHTSSQCFRPRYITSN